MSKLLETRLPLAAGGIGTDTQVDVETFNRLVRVLEINLGSVDFTISPISTQHKLVHFSLQRVL